MCLVCVGWGRGWGGGGGSKNKGLIFVSLQKQRSPVRLSIEPPTWVVSDEPLPQLVVGDDEDRERECWEPVDETQLLDTEHSAHTWHVDQHHGECGLEEQSEVQLVVPVGGGGVVWWECGSRRYSAKVKVMTPQAQTVVVNARGNERRTESGWSCGQWGNGKDEHILHSLFEQRQLSRLAYQNVSPLHNHNRCPECGLCCRKDAQTFRERESLWKKKKNNKNNGWCEKMLQKQEQV